MPNSWIFQANPSRFDIRGYLRDTRAQYWLARQHRQQMHEGDTVYLWRTGSNAGIVAIGVITGPCERRATDEQSRRHWIDPGDLDTVDWRVPVRIDRVLDEESVRLRAMLKHDPICHDLPNLRFAQGTNYLLEEHHAARIEAVLQDGTTEGTTTMATDSDAVSPHPNTILYGPPGTGKTYRTAEEAVRICDTAAPAERDAIMARYQALRDEGRIEFVTFHQSYGYEDFVEGIRPVLVDADSNDASEAGGDDVEAGSGGVRYECRDGIFKRLCAAARATTTAPVVRFDFDPANTNCWKMSLGVASDPNDAEIYEECIERGYVLLGYGGQIDFDGCRSRKDIEARIREERPDVEKTGSLVQFMHMFKNTMSVGDLVVVTEGNRKFRAIGRVTGEYALIERDSYAQMRPVEWLAVYEESLPAERVLKKSFSQSSLYRLRPSVLKIQALRDLLAGEDAGERENYVLVIDEINRGNIANILGELITLLEPDKRVGAPNELTVQLPYSGETFGVPANLHVVGTMNTADRSIALLDIALRRRFRFEELLPDAGIVRSLVGAKGVIDGIDVAALLQTINDRIELLYDRDHQIGHSYFLNVQTLADLRECLVRTVIPLLQEYFYEDWSKICTILGCPFDRDSGAPATKNDTPVIEITRLSADELPGAERLDYESTVRCRLAPAFLNCPDAALAPYFRSIISVAKPAEG